MVTVIINTINETPSILERAIDSYRNQNCQIILSTIEGDASLSIRGVDFAVMSKKEHVGKSPRGSFMQLNNALPLIKGDWFCFASGNDYAHPNKLELEVHRCKETGKEVCYSAFYTVNGTKIRKTGFHDYNYTKHLSGNFVSDCALISKRLVDKYLPFNIDLNNYAYWDLWLRIYNGEGDVFCYNDYPTWYYVQRESDMHMIRKKSPLQLKEAKRDRNRMLSLHV